MKRLVAALAVFTMAASSLAAISTDINYSTDDGGNWFYDGVSTFSFIQIVGIDDVRGDTTDTLTDQYLHIPNLVISSPGGAGGMVQAEIAPETVISIKDAAGKVVLEGTLGAGDFIAFNTISGAYSEFKADIVVSYVDNYIGSDLLTNISPGSELDFNLTLQYRSNFEDIIDQGVQTSGTLSGSMSVVPEPATLILLGLGGLIVRRKRR